ncbi:MAG: hypothetical protein IIZ41_10565 [Lachnospiraceae bacterium]|nr:hypothetical protein [Lachnospiraceae bacterium]
MAERPVLRWKNKENERGSVLIMMNPATLLTLKKKWEEFQERHPKFAMFLINVAGQGMETGSVIDITITMPDGKIYQSNMRVSEEDIELFKSLT